MPFGSEKLPNAFQGTAQTARSVDHVGGDHQVVCVRIEALFFGVLFDIEQIITDERVFSELLLCFHREHPGEVGENVFRSFRGK